MLTSLERPSSHDNAHSLTTMSVVAAPSVKNLGCMGRSEHVMGGEGDGARRVDFSCRYSGENLENVSSKSSISVRFM